MVDRCPAALSLRGCPDLTQQLTLKLSGTRITCPHPDIWTAERVVTLVAALSNSVNCHKGGTDSLHHKLSY